MRINTYVSSLWLLGIIALAGCQSSKPLSYWGNYEGAAYTKYKTPGDAAPDIQIARLQEDLDKAAAKGLNPNPGLHAYLGFVYYEAGKMAEAAEEFEAEKRLYPESAQLMDRLIAKLKTK
jgi:hypothetical protein